VVAGPGALARYRRYGRLTGPLTRLLLAGTMPGVIIGAVIRVFAVPGPQIFRLLVAALLLPLGLWLCARTLRQPTHHNREAPSSAFISGLALVVGIVGGIYGIGGGSILGPILAGRGIPLARVAPAALASTFLTSVTGATTYALLALTATGDISPDWGLGLLTGAGRPCRRLCRCPRPAADPRGRAPPSARHPGDRSGLPLCTSVPDLNHDVGAVPEPRGGRLGRARHCRSDRLEVGGDDRPLGWEEVAG
jgi:Sulfite exporter TauE/SafE